MVGHDVLVSNCVQSECLGNVVQTLIHFIPDKCCYLALNLRHATILFNLKSI